MAAMERIIAKNEADFSPAEWAAYQAYAEVDTFFEESESWLEAIELCNKHIDFKRLGVWEEGLRGS